MSESEPRQRAGGEAAERSEPRAVRTREAVMAAFLRLLDQKSLGEVSVAELCREAGIHRVTFYGHWADLETLAADVFAELIDAIASVPVGPEDAQLSPVEIVTEYQGAMARILLEISSRREAYLALLTGGGGMTGRLVDVVHRRIVIAEGRMRAHGIDTGDNHGYAAAFIAGGIVAGMAHWAEAGGDAAEAGWDATEAARAITSQMPRWWPTVA